MYALNMPHELRS